MTVYLLTDVALPVPITETAYFDALMPTRQDVAMARGVLFTTAATVQHLRKLALTLPAPG